MTGELRDAAAVASWLAVGLAVRRVGSPGSAGEAAGEATSEAASEPDDAIERAIAVCANELPALPPAGVIADIAALLGGARPAGTSIAAPEPLRGALRAYDDDVVARLVATPRFDDVLAAYAHAAPVDRAAAIALVVGALCERTEFAGLAVSPATLRRVLARPRDERAEAGRAGLSREPLVHELTEAYRRLSRGARQCRALVDEREVFAVEHVATLRDLGGRMTAAHIAAAAEAIGRRLPRRLPSRRDLRGARDTRLADDSLYPAGGFAAITPGGATTGNIENLVSSELVYMEDGASIDLFSLRYVEGELLHYTRDDSVFRRHRHVIALALAGDLEAARVKDRGLPWQRLVLALGLVIAAIRWLADQLGDEALTVHVACAPGALAAEREIVALLLEAEIARGAVVVAEQAWSDITALAARAAGTAIADVVVVSTGTPPALPHGLRALHVRLADSAPEVVEIAPRAGARPDYGGDAWLAWCDAAEDIVRWLV